MFVQPIMLAPLNTQAAIVAPTLPGRTRPVDPVQRVARRDSGTETTEKGSSGSASEPDTVEISTAGRAVEQLSDAEQKVVYKLQDRDREVRAHEQAHAAAAGPYLTSGPKYDYTTGPDGKRYAVGGSVDIDVSPIPGDPEATLRKAMVVRAAAMAAPSPSAADQQVAAMASQMAAEAIAALQSEKSGDESEPHRAGRQSNASGYGDRDETGTLFDALV